MAYIHLEIQDLLQAKVEDTNLSVKTEVHEPDDIRYDGIKVTFTDGSHDRAPDLTIVQNWTKLKRVYAHSVVEKIMYKIDMDEALK
jgi:hypothetical protein